MDDDNKDGSSLNGDTDRHLGETTPNAEDGSSSFRSPDLEALERRHQGDRRGGEREADISPLPTARMASPAPRVVHDNAGLEVHSLGKQFKKRPVLRDVSLRVQRGEAVGLLGPTAPARRPASTSSPD